MINIDHIYYICHNVVHLRVVQRGVQSHSAIPRQGETILNPVVVLARDLRSAPSWWGDRQQMAQSAWRTWLPELSCQCHGPRAHCPTRLWHLAPRVKFPGIWERMIND